MAIKVLSTAVNFAKNYTDDVARLAKANKHISKEIPLAQGFKRSLPADFSKKDVKTLLEELLQKQEALGPWKKGILG